MKTTDQNADAVKAQVREKYGELAETSSSCCSPAENCTNMSESYDEVKGYIVEADLGLGCGLPTEHAKLQPGETVLDLGSGGGLDAFIARREVGDQGRVIGVDMTEAMIEKAKRSAANLGYDNVEFHLGEIENLPVASNTIDVAVSNCVLNLVPDKQQAFREIFRVLTPGGRFCISDIVSRGALPAAIREAAELYAGCVAGALPENDYMEVIAEAGFINVQVVKQRILTLPDEVLTPYLSTEEIASFQTSETGLLSITVAGRKPERI